jgi:hypothetical protein
MSSSITNSNQTDLASDLKQNRNGKKDSMETAENAVKPFL